MTTGFRRSITSTLSLTTLIVSATLASSSTSGFAQTVMPQAPAILLPASVPTAAPTPSADAPVATAEPAAQPDPKQVECIAKIIMHEAANEPRQGRVAVAQVVRTRIRSGRFASDACAVAKQRGQFFDVDAFDPPRTDRWTDAVAIATDTLNGNGGDVAPGALFFHAAYAPMNGRVRVAQIGGHIFYR